MSNKLKVLYGYFLFVILYALGTLLIPPPKGTLQKYHITLAHLRLVDLTIIILFAIIWACAFYGFYHISHYSRLIKENKDGKPLSKIAIGIGFLAVWFPITANFNIYTNLLVEHYSHLSTSVLITQNYLSLFLPFIGFVFIGIGARQLSEITKQRPTLRSTNMLAALIIFIGVFYGYLVSTTPNRLTGPYHMPIILIMLTLVAPYIFMWFSGILSFYEIYIYRQKVKGIIYRKYWTLLAYGLGSLIVYSIILQYLTTVSERLSKLSLDWILVVVYLLLIMIAACYILIVLGVKNLKKIEEV